MGDDGSECSDSEPRTLERFTTRPAGALRSSGSSVCVSATTAKKIRLECLMQFLWRRLARRVEPIGIAEISLLDVDAGIVNKDVELAETLLQVAGDLTVILGPVHVKPNGLDGLDSRRP